MKKIMTLWKATLGLRAFGFWKVPLIYYVGPKVLQLSDKACTVCIPLNRRTRNHLGSMYFGTLAVGADCAGGLLAMHLIRKTKQKISLVFKDSKADFLRRPEADTHFTCPDGALIQRQIREVLRTKKRVNKKIRILATTPKLLGQEPVAKFELTLSLKGLV